MLISSFVAALALGSITDARPIRYRQSVPVVARAAAPANCPAPVTVTVTAPAATAAPPAATAAPPASGAISFGSCVDPSVKFAAGIDGRKATEFSFIPNNLKDFNHGSALNPDIIFQFTCDTLVNKCGFKQTDATVTACRSAQKTADALGKTGAAADSFNGALGIKTNFAALDTAAPPAAPTAPPAAPPSAPPAQNGNAGTAAPPASGAISFGSCVDPSVKFAAGIDGRKATEFSFIPNNLKDFNHGSALNPDIIFQSICDTFVNKCGLKQTDATVTTCRSAQKTADALGKTGAAADSFNGALGIKTNFAALDTAATPAAPPAPNQNQNAGAATPAPAPATPGSITFGSCVDPSVKFGAGFDGRKATEFSFLPNNLVDFNHGSALNPDIIFQFTCDTLVNKCGFKQTDATVALCRAAQKTADALGKTGAAADSFNAALGIKTNFAAIKA